MSTSHKGLKTTVAVIVLAAAVAGGLYAYKPMAVKNAVESAIQKEVDSPTVAVIGNEKVTLADLEAFKQENPHLAEVPMQMIYGQLLDTYVNQKVLLGQAEKMNLKEDPTVKRLLSDAEKQLLMQAYLARQIEARMTPERLKLIYDAEMKNFVPVDEAKIHHILVNTETEAKDMIVQLNAGADFAELASKYSVDENSSIRGGELGYIRKDMLIPELGNAAFELKKGEYTKAPVKTPVGWHVIYVDDIRQT
ncbi:MAG: peptidylprolyl isomerase, partial [Alphaproteobacteria bacterium]|nr:peptidylprolyl isomerase [Alphaproteobacteria bacterium]